MRMMQPKYYVQIQIPNKKTDLNNIMDYQWQH